MKPVQPTMMIFMFGFWVMVLVGRGVNGMGIAKKADD